jgi:BioD-like phosphotransacetylase family protein
VSKKLYVTATNRNAGKTAVVLGLMLAFEKITPRLAFMKPLGKRDSQAAGVGLDEDALLIEKTCNVHSALQDMCPVTVDRDFDESFFRAAARQPLMPFVLEALGRVEKGKDVVLIEGTGHAAMGAALGLSNADVAKAMDAKVVIVGSGGPVQAVEEIALSAAYFRAAGVDVAGAILNRARPEQKATLQGWGREALERVGVRLLGVIENKPLFESKTILQVFEGLSGQLLNGESRLSTRVGATLIGALTTHNAIEHFEDDALLVTGGDRTDLIVPALTSKLMTKEGRGLSGLILTRGLKPPDAILKLMKKTDLPVTLVRANTYDTASRVLTMEPKIAPSDKAKIELARATVEESLDVAGLFAAL